LAAVNAQTDKIFDRIADRFDLAIDFLTLGQYGLEQRPARDAGCEGGAGVRRRREALPPARRRGCRRPAALLRQRG
jgi:hypothetical protein